MRAAKSRGTIAFPPGAHPNLVSRRRGAWRGLLSIVVIAAATGNEGAADDETGPAEVSVLTVSGESVTGLLQSLDEGLTIDMQEEQSRRFARNEVLRIRPTGAEPVAAEPPSLTLLGNGDVLVGRPLHVADDLLSLAWDGTNPPTTLEIPLEFVRAVVFAQPEQQNERRQLQRQWGLPRTGADRLLLKNSGAIGGELSGLHRGNILLETALGPVSTPRSDALALTLDAALASPMPVPVEFSILLCEDGSRITLGEAAVGPSGTLTGAALFGSEIAIPLRQMTSLQLFSERVQPLAGREPQKYVFTPFLTGESPLVVNRNVHGGPLQLGGDGFASGLGVSSRSELIYDLGDEGWTAFSTTIGIDKMAGGQGHVVFRVSVDGETIYDSGDVSGSDGPIAVGPLDLSGGRRLTLLVDFGRRGNIRDIANWCDPLLSR
jgi:hypothetical protein